jgi:tetratricopeptide (TPR) repeat protein
MAKVVIPEYTWPRNPRKTPQPGFDEFTDQRFMLANRRTISVAARLPMIVLWWIASGDSICRAQSSLSVPNAAVTADRLTVYSDMRASSAVVGSLKKDDSVIVDFEFTSSTEKWCRIRLPSQKARLGYVLCAALERTEQHPSQPRRGADFASFAPGGRTSPNPGTSKHAVNSVPFAPPRAHRTSAYDEVAGLVVREGAIDVVKLAELESAARGGSVAAMARAALAHYAAGNFELSRDSSEEAIEQYRSALGLASKQPDLLLASLVSLAYVHLRRSEYSAALAYLDRGRSVAPRSVVVAQLSGWAYYGLDRAEDAIEQWKAAQRAQPDPEVAKLLDRAERDLEAESSFREGQTSHFIVHYEGSSTPQLASEILQTLEEHFRSIQSELRFTPEEPIAVVLYTQQTFRDVTRAPAWAEAKNDGRIRVPVQGLTSVSGQLSSVLKHELTHSFVRQKTQGRCPQWLNEGLAQWVEGRRSDPSAQSLVAAFEHHAYVPLRHLQDSWSSFSSEDAGFAYAWSLASVEEIIANSGMWGIERLLDTLAAGSAIEPALGVALQTNYADLERVTAEYLRRTYPR